METPDKIIVVSGGFDPLHSGHLEMIREAREFGRVIVALNSDEWLVRKKGKAFLPFKERFQILSALKDVMCVIAFDDLDNSARDALNQIKGLFPHSKIYFANGGDRTEQNIPEMDVLDVEFLFGVGGKSKANSSSWILDAWKAERTDRVWGHYEVLRKLNGAKVKTLTVKPNKSLSMQRHKHRDEYWIVVDGRGYVDCERICTELYPGQMIHIPKNTWHQIHADDCDLIIVEVQMGEICEESDIERR